MSYKPDGLTVFVFVEGKDDLSFYGPLLTPRIPKPFEVSFVKCKNKDGVKLARTQFLSRYAPNPRALFFIDRDHDDFLPAPPSSEAFLFTTAGYSIESELCKGEVVRRYCVEILGCNTGEPAVALAAEKFSTAWVSFIRSIQWPMAWVIAARRELVRQGRGTLYLRGIKTQNIIHFDPKTFLSSLEGTWNDVVKYLCKVTGGSQPHPGVAEAEFDSANADLLDASPFVWVRGKQALWLLVQVINAISAGFKDAGLSTKEYRLDLDGAVAELAPRAEAPADLVEFLASVADKLATTSNGPAI